MFSFFSKRNRQEKMFQKLESQQRIAQLSVLLTLQNEFAEAMDKMEAMRWAAAIVNDLFGNPVSEVSIAHLDMDEVRRCADALLESKPDCRELVVQSLRVHSTVHFGRHGRQPDTFDEYMRILIRYGGEFPEVPRPEVYRRLVGQTVRSLPQHIYDRLKFALETL